MDSKQVQHEALESMWTFLQMGGQKPCTAEEIESLKQNCQTLCDAMTQKTAGQRANKPNDVAWRELDAVINAIVIQNLDLYLSGDMDRLIRHGGCTSKADKIRSMSDEELAIIIKCPSDVTCPYGNYVPFDSEDCYQCCLKWLRSEGRGGVANGLD